MIQNLSIQNFKSIKDLQLDCKRVNLFIGDPNVGKSNIIESLALLNKNDNLVDLIRFDVGSQLFFDFDSSHPIEIKFDEFSVKGSILGNKLVIESKLGRSKPFVLEVDLNNKTVASSSNDDLLKIPKIHLYRFKFDINLRKTERSFLEFPYGENIGNVILSNKELRSQIQGLLEGLGYKLLFQPNKGDFEIYKEMEGFSISFPISLISDTVRRIIFYLAAIGSNDDNTTLVFEEPESSVFPYYTKYLAEKIGLDKSKQYFLTTHNPYFLQSVIEKTVIEDLSVNLVQMDHFQTKVIPLTQKGVEEVLGLGSDVFLNFEKLLEA